MADLHIVEDLRTARERGVRPSAPGADLRRADLSGADLRRADLSGADLYRAILSGADLSDADLSGADLSDADLSGADLRCADLYGADLRYTDLRYTDLRDANLYGANLTDASLYGADLTCANLRGAHLATQRYILSAMLPSGLATWWPTPRGWQMRIGCWTPPEDAYGADAIEALLDLIATDDDWPEAVGEECARRRPSLIDWAAMCRSHADYHTDVIPTLAAEWGER